MSPSAKEFGGRTVLCSYEPLQLHSNCPVMFTNTEEILQADSVIG